MLSYTVYSILTQNVPLTVSEIAGSQVYGEQMKEGGGIVGQSQRM